MAPLLYRDDTPVDLPALNAFLRRTLLEDIVPFWERHGFSSQRPGIDTCLADDGTLLSEDRYLWSQLRATWTFAALYNRIEPRAEWLRHARNLFEFAAAHGRDPDSGQWCFRISPDGRILTVRTASTPTASRSWPARSTTAPPATPARWKFALEPSARSCRAWSAGIAIADRALRDPGRHEGAWRLDDLLPRLRRPFRSRSRPAHRRGGRLSQPGGHGPLPAPRDRPAAGVHPPRQPHGRHPRRTRRRARACHRKRLVPDPPARKAQ